MSYLLGEVEWWDTAPLGGCALDLRVHEKGPPYYSMAINPDGTVTCPEGLLRHREFYCVREEQYDQNQDIISIKHHFDIHLHLDRNVISFRNGSGRYVKSARR